MMKKREQEFKQKEAEFGKILEKVFLKNIELQIMPSQEDDIIYCFKCNSWNEPKGHRFSNCPVCKKDKERNGMYINERPGTECSTSSIVFLLSKKDEDSFEIAKVISNILINRKERKIETGWELLAYTTVDINNLKELGVVNTKRKNKVGYSKLSDISNLVSIPKEFSGYNRTVSNGYMPEKVLKRLGLINLFEEKYSPNEDNAYNFNPSAIKSLMELVKQHETLEKLDKLNFKNLIIEAFSYKGGHSSIIGREGNKINEIIRVPKNFINIASQMNEKGIRKIERMVELDNNPSKELMKELFSLLPYGNDRESMITNIIDILSYEIKGITFNSSAKYLLGVNRRQAVSPTYAVGIWKDYLSMSKNMFETFSKYPKSLKLAHDLCTRDYELVKDDFRDADIKNRSKILEKLSTEDNEFKIIFPKDSKDLVNESNALGHCVKSYADRVANGSTNVAFLRRKNDINKPLYTIEFRDNRIVQIKGFGNQSPEDEKVDKAIDKFRENLENIAI